MIATFHKPHQTGKEKIVMIKPEFSSDVFAVQSWVDIFGTKDAIIEVNVETTEDATDKVIAEVTRNKDQISIVCMSAVNFVTGQLYDIKRLSEACRANNVILILQLAHTVGSCELKLHEW